MEDLTKTQIVLLCLLVSFVTSIGTGIITFSLLNEAPQVVSQTINRVVERTIEKVTPSSDNTQTITKETTVVVKEEDLVVDAISKNSKSVARIHAGAAVASLGLVVGADGLIVTGMKSYSRNVEYSALLSNGKDYPVAFAGVRSGLVLFRLKDGIPDEEKKTLVPAVFGNSDTLQLGQTVIAITGAERDTVAVGRVTALRRDVSIQGSSGSLTVIETDIPSKDPTPGAPLVSLSGQIVGFDTMDDVFGQGSTFAPMSVVVSALSAKDSAE